MESPITTFEGTLKQITPECVTDAGALMIRLCAPKFFPLTDTERQAVFEAQKANLDPNVRHIHVPARPLRRYSGDFISDIDDEHRLSAGNYFSVCVDESGLDYGTLVAELNGYRSTETDFACTFVDCLDPSVRRLGIQPSPQPVVFVHHPKGLLNMMPRDAPAEVTTDIKRAIASNGPFGMLLGIALGQDRVEGVIDLRERAAQEWFFQRYFSKGVLKPKAKRFLDVLPELLQPPLGGSTGSNIRLQAIGADLRKIGVNGLIYPSARSEIGVEYRNGRVTASRGWNMVLYRGAPPREAIAVDLGGYETAFWNGIRLEERQIDAESEGWYVVGLSQLQQHRYEHAMKERELPIY